MALTKDQKTAQVAHLKEKFSSAQSVMFAHYIGLSVKDVSDLRAKLRESDAEMKVAKKTLMKIAAKDAGLPELADDVIDGPVSCIFSFADPLSGAQVAFKFAKDHDQVELIGGIFEGKVLTKEEAIELAKMPSRQQLLGMFATMLRTPLNQFAGMCASPLSGFARALKELSEKGGANPETAAPVKEEAEESKETEGTEEKVEEKPKVEGDTTDNKADETSAEDSSESSDSSVSSES